VPPGDPRAEATAAAAVAGDEGERERLVRAGHAYARAHTTEAETARLAAFLLATGAGLRR
jgi:hypothetical protein